MGFYNKRLRLWSLAAVAVADILLITLTTPTQSFLVVALFFCLFFISLTTGLYLLVGPHLRNTKRLVVLSAGITILLMLWSIHSIGLVDGLVLAVICTASLFYLDKRTLG